MVELKWSNVARKDLIKTYNYISQDSIYYSIKTVDKIISLVDNLKILSYIGRKIPEYNVNDKRELIYKSYRIMYKIESNKIFIRRIWHSARLLPQKLIS